MRNEHLFVSSSFALGIKEDLLIQKFGIVLLFLNLIAKGRRRPLALTFEHVFWHEIIFRRLLYVEFQHVLIVAHIVLLLGSQLELYFIENRMFGINPIFVYWDWPIEAESLLRSAVIFTIEFRVIF